MMHDVCVSGTGPSMLWIYSGLFGFNFKFNFCFKLGFFLKKKMFYLLTANKCGLKALKNLV
jgi:hypothetical protein